MKLRQIAVLFFFIGLSFAVPIEKIHAVDLTEVNPSIIDGKTSDTGCPSTISSTLHGWKTYRGTYPDRSSLVYQSGNGMNQTCQVYYSMASFGNPVLGYFANGISLTPGYYWTEMSFNGIAFTSTDYTLDTYGFRWYYNGVTVASFLTAPELLNITTNTGFTDLEITGTSTVTFDVTYFLDQDEVDISQAIYNPSLVRFTTSLRPTTSQRTTGIEINENFDGLASTSETFSTTTDGVYDLQISFGNLGTSITGIVPFPNSYIYTSFTIAGGVLVATGTVEIYNGVPTSDGNSYVPQPCGLFDIGGCIQNAAAFLFLPTESGLEQIQSVQNDMAGRIPFVYGVQFPDLVDTLYSATSTANFEIAAHTRLGTTTFLSTAMIAANPLTATVRNIIAYLLWALFAIGMYQRMRTSHNKETAT